MSRARLFDTVLDATGRPVVGASVAVYEPNTTTPISETLYADDIGGTTLANPLATGADGSVLAYLDAGRRVDLYITAVGQTARTVPDVGLFPDPADFTTDTDLGNHVGGADPHGIYQKEAEKSQALGYASLDSGGKVPDAELPSGLARDSEVTTVAATLQLRSEKGANNGYAGLGAGGLVPVAQLATGTPDGTKFYRDDGTLQVPAGATPTTTRGDIIKRGTSADERLAIGTVGQALAVVDIGSGVLEPRYLQIIKRQLNYLAATDLHNGTAITAATWTDVGTNQTFTVDLATSTVEITIRGCVIVGNHASGAGLGARIMIDSAGTPITIWLGGNNQVAGNFVNAFGGAGPVFVTGLSAASHTVKVQIYSTQTQTFYCRASTLPNNEGLGITVVEFKA